jgi:hypothetical protein
MSVDIRNSHNLKKIQKFNNIDQKYNIDQLKDVIIKTEKIQKPNININNLVKSKEEENKNIINEAVLKRTNQPYKGIIKNFDYSKIREKHEEDLIVHKSTAADKDKNLFDSKLTNYNDTIKTQNTEIKQIYSGDKYSVNKKDFDYQHKYKYRSKIDDGSSNPDESDLRVDRINYYKKEQHKNEENKKKIDDILINLIDTGILTDDMNNINYDKIDINALEDTLKKEFGEEEFNKLLKELN